MKQKGYLTAKEAAQILDISLATLYAYVSRGRIHSELGPDGRTRYYHQKDIEALKTRKEQRQNPSKVAEDAMYLGAPVLESSISLITNDQLYYRGKNVANLALNYSLEEVAGLLWMKDLKAAFPPLRDSLFSLRWQQIAKLLKGISFIEAFQTLIPLAALDDGAAYDLRPINVAHTGAQILWLMIAIATGVELPLNTSSSVAEILQQHWAENNVAAKRLLNAAMVVSADHELNVSAFTARCVASAGANPYAVVTAALAAFQGYKHGGETERVEALFDEAQAPQDVQTCLVSRLRRGEKIPGFYHPLYINGDPRGKILLDLVTQAASESSAFLLAQALINTMAELTGETPTIDMGLVTLARVLNLPRGAGGALFAIGRSVGWIGHAIEQYQLDRLIRPRARYIGELEES